VLSSVTPCHISDIRDMFKFIIQRKLSEMYPNISILLRISMTSCYYCICRKKLFEAEIDKDLPPNNNGTGAIDRIGHSFNRE
jgi:hypothetical protein